MIGDRDHVLFLITRHITVLNHERILGFFGTIHSV